MRDAIDIETTSVADLGDTALVRRFEVIIAQLHQAKLLARHEDFGSCRRARSRTYQPLLG
jgi:hypothetical protein